MKIKVKGIYKDKVEPTQLLELETENPSDTLKNLVNDLIDKILNNEDELSGLFISRD